MAYLLQSDYIARKALENKTCAVPRALTNDLIPSLSGTWNLGSASYQFNSLYTTQIYQNGVPLTTAVLAKLYPAADYTIPPAATLDYTLWIKPDAGSTDGFTIYLPTVAQEKQKVAILNNSGSAFFVNAGSGNLIVLGSTPSQIIFNGAPPVTTAVQVMCVDGTPNALVWSVVSEMQA